MIDTDSPPGGSVGGRPQPEHLCDDARGAFIKCIYMKSRSISDRVAQDAAEKLAKAVAAANGGVPEEEVRLEMVMSS